MAFIAMQMASTLRASKSERKRGSGWEKERSSGPGVNERRDHRRCCRCCCCYCCCRRRRRRCCVHALFPTSLCACLWPLHNCLPFPPVVHAHMHTINQSSVYVLPLSFYVECECACVCVCVCVCVCERESKMNIISVIVIYLFLK